MTLAQLFRKLFGPVEREAEIVAAHVAADARSAVHFMEKEFEMISQAFQDALDHIRTRDAAAVQQVNDANAARDAAIADSQAKDAQISDLTAKLADATQQLADEEAAVVAAAADAPAPAPAPVADPAPPADGSGSADVTP